MNHQHRPASGCAGSKSNDISSPLSRPQTRREFAKLSLAALAGVRLLPAADLLHAEDSTAAPGRPNSKVAGVQLGINVPYSFAAPRMSGDDVLKNCVQLGISAVELRTQPVESFLGVPAELVTAKSTEATARQLADWRKSVSMDRVKEFRQKYESAGVLIDIVKVDGLFKMTDDELDYVFALAKTLGGRAISSEISTKDDDLKRIGQFADKHQFPVGYHGHTAVGPKQWENAFSFAKYNWANVDIGHFVAGNNTSPIPFITQYHDRITHIHLKDRKMHDGPNTPFGQGDTPIVDVLRLIRDNHWNIMAAIEFEYKVPAGSDRMTEIARALKYCRDALA